MVNNSIAIIPARGGSKRLPRKNILDFYGKPLIAWSIIQALQVPEIEKVVVSTDSDKIASVAHEYGAETPFVRPKELAADNSGKFEVFKHAYKACKKHYQKDFDFFLKTVLTLVFNFLSLR